MANGPQQNWYTFLDPSWIPRTQRQPGKSNRLACYVAYYVIIPAHDKDFTEFRIYLSQGESAATLWGINARTEQTVNQASALAVLKPQQERTATH
jgi:hypothetical protein